MIGQKVQLKCRTSAGKDLALSELSEGDRSEVQRRMAFVCIYILSHLHGRRQTNQSISYKGPESPFSDRFQLPTPLHHLPHVVNPLQAASRPSPSSTLLRKSPLDIFKVGAGTFITNRYRRRRPLRFLSLLVQNRLHRLPLHHLPVAAFSSSLY